MLQPVACLISERAGSNGSHGMRTEKQPEFRFRPLKAPRYLFFPYSHSVPGQYGLEGFTCPGKFSYGKSNGPSELRADKSQW